MAIIRFQPLFNDIELIRRQMDQIFDNMVGSVQSSEAWQPAIELKEADDELVLRVELPGIEGKDLDVQVRRDAVVISGETTVEKTENKETYIRSEFRYGKFQRAISLPVPIQNDKVKANFTNGVLTLNMPKHEAVKNTVVKLNFGENQPILDTSENRA
jgi:HSP20 family protein